MKYYKISLFLLFLFIFSFQNVSADSSVVITNFYNTTTGETCNIATRAGNCNAFLDPTGFGNLLPTGNSLSIDSGTYGGWGLENNTISTPFVSTLVESGVGVSRIPANLGAVSATYVCSGPTGTTMRSVSTVLDSGSRAAFLPVDTTGQTCTVTINFNQNAVDPSSSGASNLYSCASNSCVLDNSNGYFSDSSCGGQCGANFSNPASISISVSPGSDTVTYGMQTTSYFDVTVNKAGNFGADILPWCEVLISGGSTGGECSFVDGSGNPIARTRYGEPAASAAFTRYPSYYMPSNVSSVNLRLAVRNYDQYGGFSSVKTHVIPIQAGLIEESSPSSETLVCSGSCLASTNINFIVQNLLACQATSGVSATSPASSNRTFDLSWLAVAGASSYTVEVRDQTSCVLPGCGPLILNTTVAGTSVNVPYGGDVAGVTNKRFGYVIKTNYSPVRNVCSAVGSVLVAPPSGGGGGGSGSVTLLCNGVQNATISSGQNCNLTWSSTGTVPNSCTASGNWSGSGKPTSNAVGENQTNIISNKSYTLTCDLSGGGTTSGTATVNVTGAPVADIKCNGADSCTVVMDTGTPDLSWTCANSVSGSVSPGGYSGNPNGSQTVGPFSSGPQTYTLTCTSATGATATDSVVINVVNQPPAGTYSYSVNPTSFSFTKPRMPGSFGGAILVTNTGSEVLNVSAVIGNVSGGSPGWLSSLTPSNCNNLPSAGSFGSSCLINFNGVVDNLSDGFHTFDVVFNGTNVPPAQNRTVPVSVEITGLPTCPSGSVVLSSNTVNQGATVTASAPSGFSNCSFFSNNPGIASVNQSTGVVTGNSLGSTGIYASWCQAYGGAVSCPLDSSTVSVTQPSAGIYSFSVSSGLTFSANQGSLPSPSTKTITVTNTGNQTLNITRTYNMTTGSTNWGNADSASFSLAPGANRTVNVNITSSSLTTGTYDGMVTFTDTNAGQKSVPVTYTVNSGSSTGTVDVTSNWCGTVTSNPVGINCGSTCSYNFTLNTNVTLTATPKPQCLFVGWLGDCVGQGSICSLNITNNKSATPIFGLKPFNYQEF